MSTEFVSTVIDERGVATVTLDNPEKHNAFDDIIIAQLTAAFAEVEANVDARVMVLASNGRNFSAGGDLNWMKRMAAYSHEENLQDSRALADMLRTLNFMTRPTIARIQGVAFGGAVGLVSCCDMAVASSKAMFCLSEVKIGLMPATISPYVVAAIGARAARRYFTTAERFSAQQAQTMGLVSEVVDDGELDAAVAALVDAILVNSPAAVAASKQLIFDVADRPLDTELVEMTCQRIADIRASTEGQEGLSAFLEKRKPSWIQ
ncbi:enoyl-CoA hydratase/isomerase family protein [Seongchinamella unica]|uniref:Enoyl-CoA hydratase/isomerase family protein n=1 Tax=Seongchinamella unica TaxID=2547392 RepID=A0A4R5LPH3_9GAMM|nr:enoyl-CoA hydratase/isomerase family protein [Seongchinamella unica]TDG12408.1 enoyl-CoA hydratase/isomerase family protein [Seongchinamella unica]